MNERATQLATALAAWSETDAARLQSVAERCAHRLKAGGTVYAFGNGGSAAEADHFIAELAGAFEDKERPSFRAVNLSAQPATQTAHGNDFGYDTWPARFVLSEHGLRSLDVLVLLTTSGASKNLTAAAWAFAKRIGYMDNPLLIVVTGARYRGSPLEHELAPWVTADPASSAVQVFVVESRHTSRVQEVSLFLLHELARGIELAMVPEKESPRV